MPTDTKEQTQDYIKALLEEQAGAQVKAQSEDDEISERAIQTLEAIDVELARVGYEAKAPAKRAEKRPASEERESR